VFNGLTVESAFDQHSRNDALLDVIASLLVIDLNNELKLRQARQSLLK
jgi:hypothetical protein